MKQIIGQYRAMYTGSKRPLQTKLAIGANLMRGYDTLEASRIQCGVLTSVQTVCTIPLGYY